MDIKMKKPSLTVVNSELPDPPYPADTVSGAFNFDLDVQRMLSSDTWILLSPDLRPWAQMSWTLSWVRRPCGTWPSDLRIISAHLGCDQKWLEVHRDDVLRGWVMHSDGRLYHPVVTERVLEVLATRSAGRNRSVASRLRGIVLTRDGEVCAYCGSTEGPFHVDHINPLSRGGDNDLSNLCVACAPCNMSKGAKSVEEWMK